jgi:hypothetical protein
MEKIGSIMSVPATNVSKRHDILHNDIKRNDTLRTQCSDT